MLILFNIFYSCGMVKYPLERNKATEIIRIVTENVPFALLFNTFDALVQFTVANAYKHITSW